MLFTRRTALMLLVAGGLAGAGGVAHADGACIDFQWDVRKERALFAATPGALNAGTDARSAAAIVPNRLYKLRLVPQDHVNFPIAPAKKPAADTFAGLATLKISAAGSYRVALDLPLWIDVVSGGALVAAKDFESQRNCSAPHKIVEFDLTGAQAFVLQFSNATSENILLSVTPTPARTL